MKIENLKKANVGYTNTPLEFMEKLSKKLSKGNLYIKRDDMSGLALGGNKTRKLEYLVQFAVDNGYTALMTFGGVQTNHGRLTVAAAIKYGLKPILVLKGKKPDYLSGNLLLDRLMGADIYFVDYSSAENLPRDERQIVEKKFLQECADKIVKKYEVQGEKVLSIPVGGQGVIGSAGYAMFVPEIIKQMKEQNITAKYLVCGYGSTGTFAGLWAGAKYFNAPFEVIGIPIEPDYTPVEDTVKSINEISKFFDMGFTCEKEDVHLEIGSDPIPYGGTNYNEPDIETQKNLELMASTEAIILDPCYTGKIFRGFVDLIEKEIIPANENVILLHSGGAPGLFGKEHCDSLQKLLWSDEEKDHVTVMKL